MKEQKNLLVIIDMVNGFINEGALHDRNINQITPYIKNLMAKASENNAQIIAFCDNHSMEDEEFKQYPPHCLKGSKEAELIPELVAYKCLIDKIIPKNTTNGFITPEFQELLKDFDYKTVVVTGCLTDICVENFVTSFQNFIKQNKLDTKIYVPEQAVYALNQKKQPENQKNALLRMEKIGTIIIPKKIINKNKQIECEL